ncbi:CYP49A1 [Cordylochernes scorpioides]|uniref:CYP49A1 n=1 Tax=Cordylochernes scorpioides TaxID=51811 RepID=A0ABY6KQZ3_9ARAC|nr:CYP49A1 [Cordylochernes scorpioides]
MCAAIALVVLDSRLGLIQKKADSEAIHLIRSIGDMFEMINYLEFSMVRLWRWFETPSWKRFAGCLDTLSRCTRDKQKKITIKIKVSYTSHSLAFLLYDLSVHPDIQEKLYRDICAQCPDPSVPISRENIDNLPLLKACFKETLRTVMTLYFVYSGSHKDTHTNCCRLKPVVDGTARILDVEAVVSGYKVPPGEMFIFHNAQACRLPQYFPEPEKYRPERWLTRDSQRHPFLHLPFGFGIRSCVGRRLSEQETFLLTIRILQKYRLEYRGTGQLDYFTRIVNKPDRPLKLAFIPR